MQRFQPGVEGLEARWCPATTVTLKEVTTVIVRGDDAANVVVIDDQGNGTLRIAIDGGAATEYSNVAKLVVRTGLGDDAVTYNLATSPSRSLKFTVDGGAGNDTVAFNVTADLSGPGHARKISLLAGDGDDSVTAAFASVGNVKLYFAAALGAGNDALDLTMNGSVTNAGVAGFTILGEAGADALHFHALGVDVSNRSLLGITVVGGADNDVITAEYQGHLNGLGAIVLQGGQGDDAITSLATLDDGSQGTFGGGVTGDKGNDVLTLKVVANSQDIAEVLALLDGGKGQDQGLATSNVHVRRIEAGVPVPVPPAPAP